jgi:hypothetical protein
MQKDKKGQMGGINLLPAVAISLVTAGIVIALGLTILSDTQGGFVASSEAYNATADAIEGTAKLSGNLPLIGTVAAAVIVIALIVGAFTFGKKR